MTSVALLAAERVRTVISGVRQTAATPAPLSAFTAVAIGAVGGQILVSCGSRAPSTRSAR